jgi:hypothetical protein
MLDKERVKSLIISINILLPQRIIQIVKGSVAGDPVTFGEPGSYPATVFLTNNMIVIIS